METDQKQSREDRSIEKIKDADLTFYTHKGKLMAWTQYMPWGTTMTFLRSGEVFNANIPREAEEWAEAFAKLLIRFPPELDHADYQRATVATPRRENRKRPSLLP